MRGLVPAFLILCASAPAQTTAPASGKPVPVFQTSDRCIACHNKLSTPSGQDISIGSDWRTTMMANSSRDPYWHAGVRRETMDHPSARAAIEDECSTCHMPMSHYEAKWAGHEAQVFAHLPFDPAKPADRLAADGESEITLVSSR